MADVCTKTIHLFKCSPAQVHTEPLSSLWTLNISMGGGVGGSKWRMAATFAVRTGLEEKRIGHKQLCQKESHTECQQYHRI